MTGGADSGTPDEVRRGKRDRWCRFRDTGQGSAGEGSLSLCATTGSHSVKAKGGHKEAKAGHKEAKGGHKEAKGGHKDGAHKPKKKAARGSPFRQKFWKAVQLSFASAAASMPEELSPGRLAKRSKPVRRSISLTDVANCV